jgi:glycosyltransferase involved in cell wall biosynthesis
MKLAVVADYAEEGWPSMDLCAAELLARLPDSVEASLIQPRMKLRLSRWLKRGKNDGAIHILDRLVNRQWDYPRLAKRELKNRFDAYHIVDHSYSSIVHKLPRKKTGVYCHDLDAFRSILEPEKEPRPFWFRAMSQRILSGMQKAVLVFHNSRETGEALVHYKLIPRERLVHAPLGIANEFHSDGVVTDCSKTIQGLVPYAGRPFLLHVGSNIARKRIDLLLQVFSKVRMTIPEVLLVKVGNPWNAEQQSMIESLGIGNSIVFLGKLDRCDLASCYRRAHAVLVTSDAEGFGLPVIEAMACGAPVIASDIPVLRESGGSGAVFAKVGDLEAWSEGVERIMQNDITVPSRETRLEWASQFSWSRHAKIIADAYQRLL